LYGGNKKNGELVIEGRKEPSHTWDRSTASYQLYESTQPYLVKPHKKSEWARWTRVRIKKYSISTTPYRAGVCRRKRKRERKGVHFVFNHTKKLNKLE